MAATAYGRHGPSRSACFLLLVMAALTLASGPTALLHPAAARGRRRVPEVACTAVSETLGRRPAVTRTLSAAIGTTVILELGSSPARAEEGRVLRTTKESPQISQVLAVMLLRTTYDTVEGWGIYSDMAVFQRSFAMQIGNGFRSFKGRYENYDLSELYNTSRLLETRSGGITNRFYFSFLNDAQWRVIGKVIKEPSERLRFSRLVGERLYRSILVGEELKADVAEGSPGFSGEETNVIGAWPKLAEPLPKTADAPSLRQGVQQLLGYLQARGYCQGFEVSDLEASGRTLRFVSFVLDPVNLDATASLMRSNEDFAPRYDQRILQAYFADRGYTSTVDDALAEGIATPGTSKSRIVPKGIRSVWFLEPDSN